MGYQLCRFSYKAGYRIMTHSLLRVLYSDKNEIYRNTRVFPTNEMSVYERIVAVKI